MTGFDNEREKNDKLPDGHKDKIIIGGPALDATVPVTPPPANKT
jgi:hypothetical protein